MGRWTSDEHGCIYDEAGCFARLTPNKAERLASRHNADIDALTAERDEWKALWTEHQRCAQCGDWGYGETCRVCVVTAERDAWQARCKNLVEAMAVHGYSPESLARIAEGIE